MKILQRYHEPIVETLVFLVTIIVLIFGFMHKPLILGTTTFINDTYNWNLPLFHFFAESLISGNLPLWNPYSHGGEPFYPLWGVIRLGDPTNLLGIYITHFFTQDLVLIFNWVKFGQAELCCIGTYLLLRPVCHHFFTRLTLIPILFFSSMILVTFRQDGMLSEFQWAPFVALQIFRILVLNKNAWGDWILLGVLIGVNWQAYHFVGVWIFLFLFGLGLVLFRRDLLRKLLSRKNILTKFFVFSGILTIMKLPSLVLWMEHKQFVYPARMYAGHQTATKGPQQFEGGPESLRESGLSLSYPLIANTGAFSSVLDFVQIAAPAANENMSKNAEIWGHPSEAAIYLGLLPWFLSIVGIFYGRHSLRKIGLFTLGGLALFMLGPPAGFHFLMYKLYPPVWFLRHTHLIVLFFCANLLFFYVLGCNRIFSLLKHKHPWVNWNFMPDAPGICALTILIYFVLQYSVLNSTNHGLILPLVLTAGLMLVLKNFVHRRILFSALIIAQIGYVFLNSTDLEFLIRHYLLFLCLPLLLLFSINLSYNVRREGSLNYFIPYCLIFACIVIDLVICFAKASSLYAENPSFRMQEQFSKRSQNIQRAALGPEVRIVQSCLTNQMVSQSIRYPELILRTPTVFSPPDHVAEREMPCTRNFLHPGSKSVEFMEVARKTKRWNSFLLGKNYFSLIHSDIPTGDLYKIFRIGKSPFALVKQGEESVIARDPLPAFKPLNVMVDEYSINRLSIDVQSAEDGTFLWADGYDPHWKVKINDQHSEVVQLFNVSKGVRLTKGQSHVEFFYQPTLFLIAMALFYLMVVWGVIIYLAKFCRSKLPGATLISPVT